jgi:pimeloyl-ACP methyl ester carboxylesterase
MLSDRRDAIVSVLQDNDVLVGHSGGGFDITLAANAAPERIGHLVYLAAGLPLEGRPLIDAISGAAREGNDVTQLTGSIPPSALRTTEDGRLEWIDKDVARQTFYQDCDTETVKWAFARLTPAPPEILVEPVSLPNFWAADLPRSFIICLQDRALAYATAMRAAGRLGVMPFYIDSSHSPFLSKPKDLATLLVRATTTKPVASLRPD